MRRKTFEIYRKLRFDIREGERENENENNDHHNTACSYCLKIKRIQIRQLN
jgi:hypothetical protein